MPNEIKHNKLFMDYICSLIPFEVESKFQDSLANNVYYSIKSNIVVQLPPIPKVYSMQFRSKKYKKELLKVYFRNDGKINFYNYFDSRRVGISEKFLTVIDPSDPNSIEIVKEVISGMVLYFKTLFDTGKLPPDAETETHAHVINGTMTTREIPKKL